MLAACLSATAYFGYHALHGTHGHHSRLRMMERLETVQRETAVLEKVRSRLSRDVAALVSEPPSADITEEVARDVLGFVRLDEVVITNVR